jgi:hypothetical protein
MYFSRVLQNLHKLKYTNNNLYKNHKYFYYKLIQNKNKNKNNMNTKIQSVMIPYSFQKPILNYKNVKDKDSNLVDSEYNNNKNQNNNNNNIIILYSITIGTTTILLSYGIYSYIVIKQIDLLFCL